MINKYPIIVTSEIIENPYFQEKINNNEFVKLYAWLNQEYQDWDNSIIGKTTELIYNAGIDPLLYMNIVPLNFGVKMEMDKLIIPNNIDTLSDYAFEYSKIKEIVIPISVTHIGYRVFAGCEHLKIKYLGTTEQWLNIDIKSTNNGFYMFETIIECTDGNISYVLGNEGEGIVPKIN